MRTIPSNTATAALRRIAFTLVDATDLKTPEDISVTGVKANLSIDGAADAPSTNDIVKVDATAGEYYIELTQAEANQTAGALVRGWLQPTGCALTKFEAQIGHSGVLSSTVALDATERTAIANAVIVEELAAIDGFTADATTMTIDGVAHTITRHANGYILTVTQP